MQVQYSNEDAEPSSSFLLVLLRWGLLKSSQCWRTLSYMYCVYVVCTQEHILNMWDVIHLKSILANIPFQTLVAPPFATKFWRKKPTKEDSSFDPL